MRLLYGKIKYLPGEVPISLFRTELGLLFKFLALANNKKTLEQVENDEKFSDVSLETVGVMEVCTDIKLKKVMTESGGIDVCRAWEELKQDYLAEGERLGRQEGHQEGEKILATLVACLLEDGLNDVLRKIIEDIPLREMYYKKYGIK